MTRCLDVEFRAALAKARACGCSPRHGDADDNGKNGHPSPAAADRKRANLRGDKDIGRAGPASKTLLHCRDFRHGPRGCARSPNCCNRSAIARFWRAVSRWSVTVRDGLCGSRRRCRMAICSIFNSPMPARRRSPDLLERLRRPGSDEAPRRQERQKERAGISLLNFFPPDGLDCPPLHLPIC